MSTFKLNVNGWCYGPRCKYCCSLALALALVLALALALALDLALALARSDTAQGQNRGS